MSEPAPFVEFVDFSGVEPVAKTLYFAGEHTDITGHWGTVHAAMRSGLRAAAQILEDLN